MTYEELIELGLSGDPIIDPKRPAQITPEGLFIPGICEVEDGEVVGESADDLLIKIEEGGFRAWVRHPEGDPDPYRGPGWQAEAFFETYTELLHWIYDW